MISKHLLRFSQLGQTTFQLQMFINAEFNITKWNKIILGRVEWSGASCLWQGTVLLRVCGSNSSGTYHHLSFLLLWHSSLFRGSCNDFSWFICLSIYRKIYGKFHLADYWKAKAMWNATWHITSNSVKLLTTVYHWVLHCFNFCPGFGLF